MPTCRLSSSAGAGRQATALRWATAGLLTVLLALAILALPAQAAPQLQAGPGGEQGAQLFQAKCAGCHTIGSGKLVGPDLKDVGQRRDQAWIKSFIGDPNKMFAANDVTAGQLLQEYNNVKMPMLGLSPAEIAALTAYLAGSPAPALPNAAPGAAGDALAGRRLFRGELRPANGGPACLACHTVSGIGSLGGGSLGPDLTHVVQRYGEAGLSAALQNIAFPTMAGPFANRPLTAMEGADLVAFLTQVDQQQAPVPAVAAGTITFATWQMFGLGLAGMAVLFAILLFFWPRQRYSVSARLRRSSGSGKA